MKNLNSDHTPSRSTPKRSVVFLCHANPEDNAFVKWLGARLSAFGYDVWADVLKLKGGQEWERSIERIIRDDTCKVLFVGTKAATDKDGVRSEIIIADQVRKALRDPDFIIPLHLEEHDATFLTARQQYVPFDRSWAQGLSELVETLDAYNVPKSSSRTIDRWRNLQLRGGTRLQPRKELLVSNWLPMSGLPKFLWRYDASLSPGDGSSFDSYTRLTGWPYVAFGEGLLSFVPPAEGLPKTTRHVTTGPAMISSAEFLRDGWRRYNIEFFRAQALCSQLVSSAIDSLLASRGYIEHYSENIRCWWLDINHGPSGLVKFNFSSLGGKRQIQGVWKKGRWHQALSFRPRWSPVTHVRVIQRVMFSSDGLHLTTQRSTNRRRRFARSWYNDKWRDVLFAGLSFLSESKHEILVPIAPEQSLRLSLPGMCFSSNVSIPASTDQRADQEPDEEYDYLSESIYDDIDDEDFDNLGDVDAEDEVTEGGRPS